MSDYGDFLKRLRAGALPEYGTVHWNGETGDVFTAVNFELHTQEPTETVCQRAYRYFAQLSEAEATMLDIEVSIRKGRPVRAVLKSRSDAPVKVGTARLRELSDVLKHP